MERLYAVEYRNMRTALHGLLVFADETMAQQVDEVLRQCAEPAIDIEADANLPWLLHFDDVVTDYGSFDEIDFRDVVFDETLNEYVYRPFDEDEPVIIVVNGLEAAHDLYGM